MILAEALRQAQALGLERLDAQWLVEDWAAGSNVMEDSICDLTIGRSKTYLPAPYFRKDFNVSSSVKRAIVYATAQGVFELTLNGQRVGDEVCLSCIFGESISGKAKGQAVCLFNGFIKSLKRPH